MPGPAKLIFFFFWIKDLESPSLICLTRSMVGVKCENYCLDPSLLSLFTIVNKGGSSGSQAATEEPFLYFDAVLCCTGLLGLLALMVCTMGKT